MARNITIGEYIDTYIPGLRDVFLDEKAALHELQGQAVEFSNKNLGTRWVNTHYRPIPLPVWVWDQVFT